MFRQDKKEEIGPEEKILQAPVDFKPKLIHKVDPVYPVEARKEGIKGVVILEATTDEKGNVIKVKVLRPVHPVLDKAAIDAVKQWKYKPIIRDGKPVPVVFTVTVRFMLETCKKKS